MYLPTTPLEFASPFGNRLLLELRRIRLVSRALAARTMTFLFTCSSRLVALSMEWTPVAFPRLSTVTSRAWALSLRVRFPVAIAGGKRTLVLEKLAFTAQPRPHWPQKWHPIRPLCGRVRMERRPGMQVTLSRAEARLTR